MNIINICKELEELSKDNLMLYALEVQKQLVKEELDNLIKAIFYVAKEAFDCVGNILPWKKQERKMVPSCICLLEAAILALTLTMDLVKANGDCSTVDNVAELEGVTRTAMCFCLVVLKFVIAIHPPMCLGRVQRIAWKLVKLIHRLLKKVQESHIFREAEDEAFSFVLNLADPNNNKFQRLLHPNEGCIEGDTEDEEIEGGEEEGRSSYDEGNDESDYEDYFDNEEDGETDDEGYVDDEENGGSDEEDCAGDEEDEDPEQDAGDVDADADEEYVDDGD